MAASGTVTRDARGPPSRRRGQSSGGRRSAATGTGTGETGRLWRPSGGRCGLFGSARSPTSPWQTLPARSLAFRQRRDRCVGAAAPRSEANLHVHGHRRGRMVPAERIELPTFGLQIEAANHFGRVGRGPATVPMRGCSGNGDPDWIRTSDPEIRNLVLYPAELRDQLASLRCLFGTWSIPTRLKIMIRLAFPIQEHRIRNLMLYPAELRGHLPPYSKCLA